MAASRLLALDQVERLLWSAGRCSARFLRRVRRAEDLHFVQMQVVVARQLNPDKAGGRIGQQDGQRLVVAEAIEEAAVMEIDVRPATAIIG